jgi:hypothetical protein
MLDCRVAEIIQVKVGDGETRESGIEDGEKQSDSMADPMLCKLMDLHEGNRVIFMIIGRRNKTKVRR